MILHDFVRFQQQLLEFSCTPQCSDPLIQDAVKQMFSGEWGEWLCDQVWKKDSTGQKPLYSHIHTLTQYIEANPTERVAILEAFAHDIDFYDHLDDATFQFAYQKLRRATQNAVKPLMMSCYDLLEAGFPSNGYSQWTHKHFNRQNVAMLFWEENKDILGVCPACDGESPRVFRMRAYSDVDHFFPRSRYPFLSIHPYNLVPICTDCNGPAFKHSKDPIENHQRESLLDIFHPYGRPAIQSIDVQTNQGPEGALRVSIQDKSRSSRIKNLNRLLKLNDLWEQTYLPRVESQVVEKLRENGHSRRKRQEEINIDVVKDDLCTIVDMYAQKVGMKTYSVLENSYACYALNTQEELKRLEEVMVGQPAKKRGRT